MEIVQVPITCGEDIDELPSSGSGRCLSIDQSRFYSSESNAFRRPAEQFVATLRRLIRRLDRGNTEAWHSSDLRTASHHSQNSHNGTRSLDLSADSANSANWVFIPRNPMVEMRATEAEESPHSWTYRIQVEKHSVGRSFRDMEP